MTRYRLMIAALAACTQNGAAKDFYDDAEAGSTWQLVPSSGTRVDDIYGPPPYYTGACPAFALKTAFVPGNVVTGCEPGCTCTFGFQLIDDGDLGHAYETSINYDERCEDGSSLTCFNTGAELGERAYCTWLSGRIDPSVDPFGDCRYTLAVDRTD